jgi:hypothetical protein
MFKKPMSQRIAVGTTGISFLLRFSLKIRNTVNVCECVRHVQENRRDVGLQRI